MHSVLQITSLESFELEKRSADGIENLKICTERNLLTPKSRQPNRRVQY